MCARSMEETHRHQCAEPRACGSNDESPNAQCGTRARIQPHAAHVVVEQGKVSRPGLSGVWEGEYGVEDIASWGRARPGAGGRGLPMRVVKYSPTWQPPRTARAGSTTEFPKGRVLSSRMEGDREFNSLLSMSFLRRMV